MIQGEIYRGKDMHILSMRSNRVRETGMECRGRLMQSYRYSNHVMKHDCQLVQHHRRADRMQERDSPFPIILEHENVPSCGIYACIPRTMTGCRWVLDLSFFLLRQNLPVRRTTSLNHGSTPGLGHDANSMQSIAAIAFLCFPEQLQVHVYTVCTV